VFEILAEWFDNATPFQEEMLKHDLNHDGLISTPEAMAISQKDMDVLRDNAHTEQEWSTLREMCITRGEYKDTTGVVKGFDQGEGGRFRFLTDEIQDTNNVSRADAKELAAHIGRRWGKI